MICLPLCRERWEILFFSIKSSCWFYNTVNSSATSRDTCPWCNCWIHSCSLKVNHWNVGLIQPWEIKPDRCSSHLLFRASNRQDPTISPSQSSLILIQNLLCHKLGGFLLVLCFKLYRELVKEKVLRGRSERHRYKEESIQPGKNVTEKGQIAIHDQK